MPYSATVDPAIPVYKPVEGLSGTLKGVESNTVTDLMQAWIDGFTKIYPNVKISVDIGGSGQGGPRLTNGAADFGFIGREMMGREETPFIDKFGYKPLAIAISGGSVAVEGVHRLHCLHRQQGQSARTRSRIRNWTRSTRSPTIAASGRQSPPGGSLD